VQTITAQLAEITDIDDILEGRRRAAALGRYVAAKADKEAVKRVWLLTAKRIGELIGPAVGATGTRGWESSLTSELITKDDRYRFRLLAEHWTDIADVMISGGTFSQSAIIAEIEKRMRDSGEITVHAAGGIRIEHAAAADLSLDAESADLILTDPPYPAEYLDCWDDLAKVAKHALRPGGLLVAYSGQMFIREAFRALSDLEYVWLAAIVHDGPFFQLRKYKIQVGWKPLLVFGKPPVAIGSEWLDTLTDGRREKDFHGWQQSEAEAAQIIQAFTVPGDHVVDPFTGGGTTAAAAVKTGRLFTGCDIDQQTADRARERVSLTAAGGQYVPCPACGSWVRPSTRSTPGARSPRVGQHQGRHRHH
jgi:site-specific DNA-methyltransferase (adenine-specific)